MPEPSDPKPILGKQLLRMRQTSSPPRSWMSIRMNDGLSLLVPCLKAFSISEMNSSRGHGRRRRFFGQRDSDFHVARQADAHQFDVVAQEL